MAYHFMLKEVSFISDIYYLKQRYDFYKNYKIQIVYVSKISNISIIFQINSWTAWSHDIDGRAEVRILCLECAKERRKGWTDRKSK